MNVKFYNVSDGENISVREVEIEDKTFFNEDKVKKLTDIINLLKIDDASYFEIGEKSIFEYGKKLNMPMLNIQKGDRAYSCAALFVGSKEYKKTGSIKWLYEQDSDFILKASLNYDEDSIEGFKFFGYHFDVEAIKKIKEVLYWTALEQSFPKINKHFEIFNKNNVNVFSDCVQFTNNLEQSESFAKYFLAWKKKENVFDSLTEVQKQILDIINCDLGQTIACKKLKGGWSVPELF